MIGASCFSPVSLWQSYFDAQSLPFLCQVLLDSPTTEPSLTVLSYLPLFVLTCGIEAPIYGFLLRPTIGRNRQLLPMTIFLNLATHPFVTWAMPRLIHNLGGNNQLFLLISEIIAPTIEAMLLRFLTRLDWPSSIFVAGLANLVSWWLGTYIFS